MPSPSIKIRIEKKAIADDEFSCPNPDCRKVTKIENCRTITVNGQEFPFCPECGSSNILRTEVTNV